jgi:hypothetical protein
MSTLKADTVTTKSDDTDLTITGGGTGVPNLEAGFKVGGSAGVPTASIQDDAVTLAKMAAGTDGNLITYDASGDPAHVATGTATHVLTSNGAGAAPTFQAAGGGGTVLISSVLASGAASVDFDSALSSTYTSYLLVGSAINPATNDQQLWLRTSSDGGSSWDSGASDYSWVGDGTEPGGGTAVARYDFADVAMALSGAPPSATGLTNAAVSNSSFWCVISDPSDTTLYTTFNVYCCIHGAANEFGSKTAAGCRLSATAMDSVQVLMESGNIDGRFNLYGLADS